MPRCIWCNADTGELIELSVQPNSVIREHKELVYVHPEHRELAIAYDRRFTAMLTRLLAQPFVLLFCFVPCAAVASVKPSIGMPLMGLVLLGWAIEGFANPTTTVQTIRLMGIQRAMRTRRTVAVGLMFVAVALASIGFIG